jgi:hypothetical protein
MNLPTLVAWSNIQPGQVYSQDLVNYYMKCDNTNNVNLAPGVIAPQGSPTSTYTVFPDAYLAL